MYHSFRKQIRKHFRAVLRTKKSAHSIAMGAAVGTLIGTLPIPFVDFFIALIVVLIFERINKYSLFAAVVFWNPFTKIPIYTLSYTVGDVIFKDMGVLSLEISFWDNLYIYTRRFLVGNILIAVVLTIVTYLIVHALVLYIKRVHRKKMD